MNNEKPYIEYNNKKYEFEAKGFSLKREYDNAIKSKLSKVLLKKGAGTTIKELQEFSNNVKNKNLTAEEIEKNPKLKDKLLKMSKFVDKLSLYDVYYEFCFKNSLAILRSP